MLRRVSLLAFLASYATAQSTPRPGTEVEPSRTVRCTPCEDRYDGPGSNNYVNDPSYRGNGADNLGYDWSPSAWGGRAFPRKEDKDRQYNRDDYRGGRQMWSDQGQGRPCLKCGPSWEADRGFVRKQGEFGGGGETVTSAPLGVVFRKGHGISYVPAQGGDMHWDGVSGGGMRWDGFSNGISWITRGAPWDRQDEPRTEYSRPGFKPWDNSGKGSSGWDNSGKGYYFAGGQTPSDRDHSRPGYASSWQYSSGVNDINWSQGNKPYYEGDKFNQYQPVDRYGQGGSHMFGSQYPRQPDKNYLPDRYPQPRPDTRPWNNPTDRYDSNRPTWNQPGPYPNQRPHQEYLPQDKYPSRPSYGSGERTPTVTIWNGRPNDLYSPGASYPPKRPEYPQDSRPSGTYPQTSRPSYPPNNNPGGYPQDNRPSYPQNHRPSGYPQDSRPSYPQDNQIGGYPQDSRPGYPHNQPGDYPQNRPNYPQNNKPSGYPQDNRPSGYPQDNRPSGYPQDNRPSGYPNENRPFGNPHDNRPSGYPQDNRPSGYPQDNRPSGYQQDNRPSGYPQNNRPSKYPQDNKPYGYPQENRPSGYPLDNNRPSGYPSKGQYHGIITEISNEDGYGGSQLSGNDRYTGHGNRYPSSGDYDRGPYQGSSDGNSWNYGQDDKDGTYRRTGGSYPPYKGGQYYTSSYLASASTPSSVETKPATKPDETTQSSTDS